MCPFAGFDLAGHPPCRMQCMSPDVVFIRGWSGSSGCVGPFMTLLYACHLHCSPAGALPASGWSGMVVSDGKKHQAALARMTPLAPGLAKDAPYNRVSLKQGSWNSSGQQDVVRLHFRVVGLQCPNCLGLAKRDDVELPLTHVMV